MKPFSFFKVRRSLFPFPASVGLRGVVPLVLLLFAACRSYDPSNHPNLKVREYNLPQTKDLTAKIVRDTNRADLYFQRGNALRRMHLDSLAAADYIHAVRLDTNKAEYLSAIGDLLFEARDLEGSREWLRKALLKNPKDPRARLNLAKGDLINKDYKSAFDQINTVLRANPYEADAYFLKGMVYKDLKDTNRAISSFQTALQAQPDYKEAHMQLGFVARDRGDSTALQYFRNAYLADTNDLFPVYTRGQYFQEKNQWERAKDEYHFAIDHAPEYADAHFAMGYVFLQQDSVEKALPYFRKAAQLDPKNPNAAFNAGICEEYLGNTAAARTQYEAALKANPNYAAAQEALKRVK